MESEHPDFDTIIAERRAMASETMKPIDNATLKAVEGKLFPTVDHPWHSIFHNFLTEHKDSLAVHGTIDNGVEFIFYPKERQGMWFRLDGGVRAIGPIMERGLTALTKIAADQGLR